MCCGGWDLGVEVERVMLCELVTGGYGHAQSDVVGWLVVVVTTVKTVKDGDCST